MTTLLIIDVALETAFVILVKDTIVLDVKINKVQQTHASWLHIAIEQLCNTNNVALHTLQAIAVTNGPGSYTGLRIGMSAAKGLCYALQIPLITLDNLKLIALANNTPSNCLYIPMIDARRDEVYCCTFNTNFEIITTHSAVILNADSFEHELAKQQVIFCGDGAAKFSIICTHTNAIFSAIMYTQIELVQLALQQFNTLAFANLTYAEPNYIKPFYIAKK